LTAGGGNVDGRGCAGGGVPVFNLRLGGDVGCAGGVGADAIASKTSFALLNPGPIVILPGSTDAAGGGDGSGAMETISPGAAGGSATPSTGCSASGSGWVDSGVISGVCSTIADFFFLAITQSFHFTLTKYTGRD
jgi:hypothetical protein